MCPWNKSEANPADAQGSFHPYSLQEFGCGYKHAGWGGSLNMFSGEQLPVKKAVADNFGVFNNYYTSVPGFSVPNHLFAQSGTSCGASENVGGYSSCGAWDASVGQLGTQRNRSESSTMVW